QLQTAAGLTLFELKSFAGRLTASRRAQVAKSLRLAEELSPAEWSLVVPVDHTLKELEWFGGLTAALPFPCRWLGRTWLDSKIAQFPEISSYYLADSGQAIVDALRELAREQSALARGVPDAADRLGQLTARLNAIDPHYAFGLSSMPDGSTD